MDFLFIFLLGLVIGSFLNVCISRIPQGESISFPPSRCDYCHTYLKPWDLVPIASFLLLGRKCRYCGAKLSWRYPGIEVLTGMLFLFFYLQFGLNMILLAYLFLASLLVVISFIDIDHYRIPNPLILMGIGAGVGFIIFTHFIHPLDALLGFSTGGGILFFITLVSRGGMGGGDIKLGALIGLFLGLKLSLISLFIAALFASIIGILLIVLGKKSPKDALPFGPFLALGAILSLFWGNDLLSWYIHHFVA
jgi:leader peptidase (prepilin peptidase)/N-methyltransferase